MAITKIPELPPIQKTNHRHSHNLSFTYVHKLAAVESGECVWTGRLNERFAKGDRLTLFGWDGKAYASKWAWSRKAIVVEVVNMTLLKDGILLRDPHPTIGSTKKNQFFEWASEECDRLAAIDFINPPTGIALQAAWLTINSHKLKMVDWKTGVRGQHVRWEEAGLWNSKIEEYIGDESDVATLSELR